LVFRFVDDIGGIVFQDMDFNAVCRGLLFEVRGGFFVWLILVKLLPFTV